MTQEIALGYTRLSTLDQSNYSLIYQEKGISDYCTHNDLMLEQVFTDNGYCSDTFDRPDYKKLEQFIKQHKGRARYLIVKSHDRFSRNLPEALLKIDELQRKYNIKVLATNESVDLDLDDPGVYLQRVISYTIAENELKMIRVRTKAGVRTSQLAGRYVCRAPFGYVNAKDGKTGIMAIDSKKAEIVRFIFKQYIEGSSFAEIRKAARKMGFDNFAQNAIQRILVNQLYAGLVKVSANKDTAEHMIKGLHQPIISEFDYWKAQNMLGLTAPKKSQPRPDFPLRGLLNCKCGKTMTACYSKGKRQHYMYYRCIEHGNKGFNGSNVHEQFERILSEISFTKKQINYITEQIKAQLNTETKDASKLSQSRKQQLKAVHKKIENVEQSYFEREIDLATYNKWIKRYSAEIGLLTSEIDELYKRTSYQALEDLQTYAPMLKNLKEIYLNASLTDKHKLIYGVFEHKLTYSESGFRTPFVGGLFEGNLLKAKEKGLIEINEISQKQPLVSPPIR